MTDIEIKLRQNQKDLDSLLKEKERLEKQLEEAKNPIESYCKNNPVYDNRAGYIRFAKVVAYKGKKLVSIPLPSANREWTFAAFDWVKAFCKNFSGYYPLHSTCEVPQISSHLYIGN